jgi:3-hydroxymyristoyl/3-hydroxydecanoyl-(acyl carrier protein) dehydratase
MSSVRAADVLRHRPPFLFVDYVTMRSQGCAVADIAPELWTKVPPWRAPEAMCALPIELAAQVAGVALRTRLSIAFSAGFLAAVSSYRVLSRLHEATQIEVNLGKNAGAYHAFEAVLTASTGAPCAEVFGSIFLGASDATSAASKQLAAQTPISTHVTAEAAHVSCWLDPTQSFYAGHFPEAPITPGILLLEMATQVSSSIAHAEGQRVLGLAEVTDAVFQRLVPPGSMVEVRARLQASNVGRRNYAVSLFVEGARALRARVALRTTNDDFDFDGGKNAI